MCIRDSCTPKPTILFIYVPVEVEVCLIAKDDFVGKICMARNLEPRIPEECLVIQLSYHYDDAIQKAHMYSQVKTIQDMASLLAVSYTHLDVYKRQAYNFFQRLNKKLRH